MNKWQDWNNPDFEIKKFKADEIPENPVFVMPPGYRPVSMELADDERTVIVKRRPEWDWVAIGVATVETKKS